MAELQFRMLPKAAPQKIKALVYLSAYMPQDGQSILDLAKMDRDSHLGKPGYLVLAPDYSTASIKPEDKADIFANDANETDRAAIVDSLITEPAAPQGIPVKLTDANWGQLPKFYIETTKDHCVSPDLQEQMMSKTKLVKVTKLDAGHASYMTKPHDVSAAIIYAAKH